MVIKLNRKLVGCHDKPLTPGKPLGVHKPLAPGKPLGVDKAFAPAKPLAAAEPPRKGTRER